MTWTKNILVVANATALTDDLRAALRAQAGSGPTAFHLILPATPLATGRTSARDRLHTVIQSLRADGLRVDGEVGNCDPIVAVMETWDPKRYDAIVVSTLPMRVSKWLHQGLPGADRGAHRRSRNPRRLPATPAANRRRTRARTPQKPDRPALRARLGTAPNDSALFTTATSTPDDTADNTEPDPAPLARR